MMYWSEKNKISEEEKRLIQSFFIWRFWTDKIDVAYFMVCDPEVAMARELRIALSRKLGETTNPETIRTLVNRYRAAYQILSPQFPQLRLRETTHMEKRERVKIAEKKTLKILKEKAKGGQ